MDAQAKWEATALNALEQAMLANARLAKLVFTAAQLGGGINPQELIDLIHETQIRLARDLRTMRNLTVQREKDQP
jgi:hypothetical protein